MRSCPTNLLSLSRLVDVGAVLHYKQGDCWFQPPPRFTSQEESERVPLYRVGGLYEITLHKSALDLDTTQVPRSSFKAQVDSGFACENWGPTDFCVAPGDTFVKLCAVGDTELKTGWVSCVLR